MIPNKGRHSNNFFFKLFLQSLSLNYSSLKEDTFCSFGYHVIFHTFTLSSTQNSLLLRFLYLRLFFKTSNPEHLSIHNNEKHLIKIPLL